MAPNNTTPEEQRDRSGDRAAGAGPLIGGTVFVGVITACALVLSYHGLYQLAEYGGHEGSAFAHVFPVTYALIVLMAFWVSYVLRSAPPRDRLWVDVGLIPVLILFAGATMVARNLGLFDPQITGPLLSERVANVIVAVAPLAALLIAILLWITVRAHMRRRNRGTARPKPSADRTTVLPARRPASEEPEPAPLKTRLFDLGQENRGEDEEDSTETERLPAVGAASERDGEDAEPEPVADTHAFARPEEPEEPEEPDEVRSEAPAEVDPPEEPEPEPVEARSEPGPETGSLPRRTGGDNPIKRAAEQPPVVPGAAPPREPEPAPEDDAAFHPVVVPDHLADEGFEHQSPVGDPVTDEAEAPREEAPDAGADLTGTATESPAEPVPAAPARAEATPPVRAVGTFETPAHGPANADADPVDPERPDEGRPAPDAGAAAAGPGPAPAPAGPDTGSVEPDLEAESAGPAHDVPSATESVPFGAPSETPSAPDHPPEEAPVASAGLDDEEDGDPASPAPDPAGDEPADESADGPALWEPPTEETGGILDDYVPPVWTPPEDDGPLVGTSVGETEGSEVADGPVPALDHDTGPEVRAAFGRPAAVPPGASVPEEPEHTPDTEEHDRSEPGDADSAPEPTEVEEPAEPAEPAELEDPASDAPPEEPADDGDAVRRTTPPPLRRTPPPPAKPRSSPAAQAQDARSLRKRPMVLKPRRPPIPDLNSGPPSRQVRSEPMRPED
ncbi:DUF2637 domain-containing protein [Nocardiopsis sp. HNM0947]|uniref:DUF2637 domain-containing protein n=1 Tax=Nocardiopsis coralli TaxID=2772213 RepID=A0ABR9P4G6_9ACTN|nr:DUF2637 domain-containing protein [Nocardiopsis coralli]MBE2998736.1 DUF2637 domain-containing protein [Nocardiopsis coralli]